MVPPGGTTFASAEPPSDSTKSLTVQVQLVTPFVSSSGRSPVLRMMNSWDPLAPTPTVPKANCVSGTSTRGVGPTGRELVTAKSPARQGLVPASNVATPPPTAAPSKAATPVTTQAFGMRIVSSLPRLLGTDVSTGIVAKKNVSMRPPWGQFLNVPCGIVPVTACCPGLALGRLPEHAPLARRLGDRVRDHGALCAPRRLMLASVFGDSALADCMWQDAMRSTSDLRSPSD